MKVKITLITENNVPLEDIGDNPEEKIKSVWDMFLQYVAMDSKNGDRGYVEDVEILRGEEDETD